MKIGFNPHAAMQAQSARGPQAPTTPPVPEGSDNGVTITLSHAARQILKMGDAPYNGDSPAHQARAAMLAVMEGGEVAGLTEDDLSKPYGQIVKMFAHAKHAPETEDAPPVDGGDTGATTETGGTGTTDGDSTTVVAAPEEGGGTGIAETHPTIVVEAPDIIEVLDESAPTDDETTAPGDDMAGSGDAMAEVDTGDLTDELLDQLDETSEEVV